MSFSVHRPGRMGSDGRIDLSAMDEDDPQYLDDVLRERRRNDDLIDDVAPEPSVVAEPARPESSDGANPAAATAAARDGRARRTIVVPRFTWGERMPLPRRLAVLGGAQGEVLDDVPSETSRFVQMFFVLLSTAVVSAISMFFALITGVHVGWWVALPLAVVWALIIFNLDRFLTSTMRSTRNIWRLFGLAFPRVIMAALIGIVVAEPLVLQIFQNDIAREVTSTNVTQSLSDQEALAAGPEKQALDAAAARVSALENQASTGIVEGTSSTSAEAVAAQATVDQLTAQLGEQQATIDRARTLYQCELTGAGAGEVEGCTGVEGEGASSDAAETQLAQAQAAYDDLAQQLEDAQAALTSANSSSTAAAAASAEQNKQQAIDQLPTARETYETALAAYNGRAEVVADSNANAQGMLSQITALSSLSEKEPALGWAHWLIAALFFMIELLPVIVKVLTSFGDPSLYEKADALRRQVALDRVTSRTWNERAEVMAGQARTT